MVFTDVVVYMLSERPPLSGVLKTWIEVGVKESSGDAHELFIPYLQEDTHIPEIGATCDVYYHYEELRGLVGTKSMHISAARIVDKFVVK
jgi:hypothetical protein